MESGRGIDHVVQFDIITFTPTGHPMSVCRFGPDRAGFSTAEVAKGVLAVLEKVDQDLGRTRIYEIQPLIVSEDYGKGPDISIDLTDEEVDEMQEMIDAAQEPEDDNDPSVSN